MNVERLSRDWNQLAEEDALWAVLAEPAKKGSWQLDEFFATGEREIEAVLEQAEGLGYPKELRRALDFGCGVGRLTRALAERFEECVGVDVSEEMVRRARELNADCSGLSFVVNVAPHLRRFQSDDFDFVYSSKVLQHLPRKRLAAEYVAEFVRLVKPGGIAVFQLWTSLPLRNRIQPRRRAYGLLHTLRVPQRMLTPLGLSPMGRGIAIPEARIRRTVEAAGGQVIHTQPDGEWGLFYFVVRDRAASPRGRGRAGRVA